LGLTLLAFGLRVWGVTYGFPQPWARPDELRWVQVAVGLIENPDPRWFQWPTLHAYLLAAVYWVWGQFRLWRGDYPSFHAFLNEDESVYPADLVLLGRLMSAAIGALVVPLLFLLARRLGTQRSALLAATFMAISFGPLRDAHWALIEPLLLLGIVATLLALTSALDVPSLGRFAFAGLLAGLTTSAKYSGASLAVPITLAVFFCRRRAGASRIGTLLDARLWVAATIMVLGFLAGSPFVLVSRAQFMGAMAIREWSYRDASFGTDVGFVHHLLFSARYSHGLLMEAAGLAGLLLLGFRSPGRWLVTAYGVATYLGLGPARIVPMRYASSIAPCLVLGAAWAVTELTERARRPRLLVASAALALIAEPLYRDVRFDSLLCREDTRVTARNWLGQRYPAGTTILVRDSKSLRWGRPALEDAYLLVGYKPKLARQRQIPLALLAESETGYIPWAPDVHDVLREVGSVVALFDPFGQRARPVYDPHDAFFVPVAGFEDVRAPGPRITIYAIPPKGPITDPARRAP